MTLEEAKKEINKNQSSPTIACNRDYDSGWEDAIFKVIEILEQVDTVPVPKDTMTLKELAHEMRKLFEFKYLTVSPDFCGCPIEIYCWTSIRPTYNAKGRMWIISQEGSQTIAGSFEAWHLEKNLNLSEYADENGEIDYSKCIVEVE